MSVVSWLHRMGGALMLLVLSVACSQEAPQYPDQALLICNSNSDCPTDWECLPCLKAPRDAPPTKASAPRSSTMSAARLMSQVRAVAMAPVRPGNSATMAQPIPTPMARVNAAILPATAMRRIVGMKSSRTVRPVMRERATTTPTALRVPATLLAPALAHIVVMGFHNLNLRPARDANTNAYSTSEVCNNTCQGYAPRCGDGQLQTEEGETCDDGDANTDTYSGSLEVCDTTCRSSAPFCGDGIVSDSELCDDGAFNTNLYTTERTCNVTCDGDAPYCGDGVLQGSEVCDDGLTILMPTARRHVAIQPVVVPTTIVETASSMAPRSVTMVSQIRTSMQSLSIAIVVVMGILNTFVGMDRSPTVKRAMMET